MSDGLQPVLSQSLEEVLEKMFFIRPLEDPDASAPCGQEAVSAHLSFDGDPAGSLTLRVTRDAARSISADFLGENPNDLTPRQVTEVICELANMICGSVLSRIESTATFRLIGPQLGEAPDLFPGGTTAAHCLEIDGGSVTVILRTEIPVCPAAEKPAF